MMTLIVARARNGAIGRDGDIPWHAPEDLKAFQRETLGGAIIMGRRTWESLPFRPLKRRFNCVVSGGQIDGADAVCTSVEAAMTACAAAGYHRIYGIGGAGIYQAMLPLAHRLMITEVDLDVPDADTFFPRIDPADWTVVARTPLRSTAPVCELGEWLRL
ncbi:dihydrofolate reductase [Meridianimarinicoccus sp. MJW13]|uniref:dihydrofolate reductase n=1 Tax=Meridianimarinicoccus sp. MJW13 TaxID=2720031 RepID=UPI001865A917|nr:dihydrofolate reductase [Fluviibacterium sp. MJW13]